MSISNTQQRFDVMTDKFNVLVYMDNIEAHKKDDNCFHDDDDTQINMRNLKHKQRQSRL